MTPIKDPAFHIQDVPRLFSKYGLWILLATLTTTTLSIVAAQHVSKKYKAHFVLTIYSKYFQSPLVGDFVPGLSESSDMKSQRDALIRQALTPDFLDTLGRRYGIYGSGTPNPILTRLKQWGQALGLLDPENPESLLSEERESLRNRIEIYSLNNTTFNVGFIYSDPNTTLKVTQDIYAEVIRGLLDVRTRIIGNIRNAIQSRLGSLSPNTPASPESPTEAQFVEDELDQVRSELRSLRSQYTEEHPLVMQMRDRERILVSRLGNASSSSSGRAPRREKSSAPAGSGQSGRDMYGDLTKKLNYLDIAMDSDQRHQSDYFAMLETPLYPAAPLWPKKGLLALWGFALGFFGSLFIVALKEYFERSTLHAETVAHELGLPFLGHLPPFPSKASGR